MFTEGQWIRWTTPTVIKQGQVVLAKGCSIVVEWMGGDRQVFPVIDSYLPPFGGGEWRMEIIERPKEALRVERDTRRGVMSVKRAAAILGQTPKQIRAKLRSGALKGVKTGDKWTGVEL